MQLRRQIVFQLCSTLLVTLFLIGSSVHLAKCAETLEEHDEVGKAQSIECGHLLWLNVIVALAGFALVGKAFQKAW